MRDKRKGLTGLLNRAPAWLFAAYAVVASFGTYFCMYAFRKPFSAATYEGLYFLGTEVNLKTVFVISQILGYCLSKYLGIKICSEVTRSQRRAYLIGLITIAWTALLGFAILPDELKVVAIFLNGIPLGMVWGLVVWYLEGRQTSEILLAGLSCSFIVASGIVKDIGRALMRGAEHLTFFAVSLPGVEHSLKLQLPNPLHSMGNIPQFWMPFAIGGIFYVPFALFVFMLDQLPEPSKADELARTHREPMDLKHRIAFLRHYLAPLLLLFVTYFFLTAYRDFRDNFGVELFNELGYGESPNIFSRSEIWVAFGVLAPLASLSFIRNNTWGLISTFGIMLTGCAILIGSTMMFDTGRLDGLTWMILSGLGSYLAYVPFGSVLYDRMIAATHVVGTAVFAIYVSDALGYTGSVGLLLYKDLVHSEATRLEFFLGMSYLMGFAGLIFFVLSCILVMRSARKTSDSVWKKTH